MVRSLEQTQNENHKNITVTSVDFRATPQFNWRWYTSREYRTYGVEGNVEHEYIENEGPTFVSPTEEILERFLHAEVPLNYFPSNYGINL